jgi:hypothetical protein
VAALKLRLLRSQVCIPIVTLKLVVFATRLLKGKFAGKASASVTLATKGPAGSDEIPRIGVGEPRVVGVRVKS